MSVSLIKYISRDFLGTPAFTKMVQTEDYSRKETKQRRLFKCFFTLGNSAKKKLNHSEFHKNVIHDWKFLNKKEFSKKFLINLS